jgi:cbb3-type cytochrome oxidase subunit 3
MNLIKEYLGSIAGVQVFGILAMLIFLITFLFMIYHTYSMRKEDSREYGRLPLEEEECDQNQI